MVFSSTSCEAVSSFLYVMILRASKFVAWKKKEGGNPNTWYCRCWFSNMTLWPSLHSPVLPGNYAKYITHLELWFLELSSWSEFPKIWSRTTYKSPAAKRGHEAWVIWIPVRRRSRALMITTAISLTSLSLGFSDWVARLHRFCMLVKSSLTSMSGTTTHRKLPVQIPMRCEP